MSGRRGPVTCWTPGFSTRALPPLSPPPASDVPTWRYGKLWKGTQGGIGLWLVAKGPRRSTAGFRNGTTVARSEGEFNFEAVDGVQEPRRPASL